MRYILIIALTGLLGACASIDGRGLVPGQSTAGDVQALMGTPVDKRAGPGGETVYYYPQLPYGRATYVARIGPDDRLIAIEQRLTDENIGKLVKERTTAKEVRDLLGPPYQPQTVARMNRDIWTYPMHVAGSPNPKWLLVQLSIDDGIVRETYLMDDPDFVPRDGGRRR